MNIYLFSGDGALGGLVELLNGLRVVAQILLTADQNDRETLAEVEDLGNPLFQSVSLLPRYESKIPGKRFSNSKGMVQNGPSPERYRGNRGSRQRNK